MSVIPYQSQTESDSNLLVVTDSDSEPLSHLALTCFLCDGIRNGQLRRVAVLTWHYEHQ